MIRLASPPRVTDVTIRPLTEADLPALEWDGAYTHYRPIFLEMWRDMQRGQRWLLVAASDHQMVGQVFLQFWSSDPRYADGRTRAYLYALRVKPPWRQLGLGTRLVQTAEDLLCARGFDVVTIAVAKDNFGALRLYQRLGYAVFSDDPGVWYFTDVNGVAQTVEEPCWVLGKCLR